MNRLNFAQKAALALIATTAQVPAILMGIVSALPIRAQFSPPQSAGVSPKFEVISVRPCQAASEGGRGGAPVSAPASVDPGMLRLECRTADDLIRMAYIRFANGKADGVLGAMDPVLQRLIRQPIDGSPSWIRSERYTVNAKSETPQSTAMMQGPMLQALLEDRFKLKVRRDVKELPVYELVVGNGGPKLVASKNESCAPLDFANPPRPPGPGQPPLCGPFRPDKNGGVETFGQTLAGLCMQFSAALDRPVVDRTGIAGTFDIHLDLTSDDLFPFARRDDTPAATDPQVTSVPPDPLGAITRAVQRLGLKLESAKTTAEFIVIEHVERPSEN